MKELERNLERNTLYYPNAEDFFHKLDGDKPPEISITPEDIEKYNLLATGLFHEGEIKVNSINSKEITKEEKAAKDFVNEYTAKFIEKRNEILKTQGRPLIGNWPKMKASEVNANDKGCSVTIEKNASNYGQMLIFRDMGAEKIHQEYTNSGGTLSLFRFKELFLPAIPTVCGLVFTDDNHILLTKRHPDKVGSYVESWHAPGGYMDPEDFNKQGELDPFVSIKRELKEEVGLNEEQIEQTCCLGISHDPNVGNVEFLFIVHTKLKSTDIIDSKEKDFKKRLLLRPADDEGDIRSKKIINNSGTASSYLPALLRLDSVFGKDKKSGKVGPELTVPTSKALVFLADRLLKDSLKK